MSDDTKQGGLPADAGNGMSDRSGYMDNSGSGMTDTATAHVTDGQEVVHRERLDRRDRQRPACRGLGLEAGAENLALGLAGRAVGDDHGPAAAGQRAGHDVDVVDGAGALVHAELVEGLVHHKIVS